jgi:hypothetical protein
MSQAAELRLRLRIEPYGKAYRLVHEDSEKVLCSGSMDALLEWIEGVGSGRHHPAPKLRAAIADGIAPA